MQGNVIFESKWTSVLWKLFEASQSAEHSQYCAQDIHRARTLLMPKLLLWPKPMYSSSFSNLFLLNWKSLHTLFSLAEWQKGGNLSNSTGLPLFLCISNWKLCGFPIDTCSFVTHSLFIKDSSASFCSVEMTSRSFDYLSAGRDSWKTSL